MRLPLPLLAVLALSLLWVPPALAKPIPRSAKVLFERTTNYHHIVVYDLGGVRTLAFDGSEETIMRLNDPVHSGFEYLNFFHAPFAFNGQIERVLMVGLGGGSAAKQFQAYYPEVALDIVDIDGAVVEVAKEYFQFTPGPKTRIHVMDGRQFLRGTQQKYDLILMDAYTSNPYGSFIPFHLATQEFFQLARSRLTDGGLLAYNVIGQIGGWRKNIIGSLFKTMETSFATIYMFPAASTRNVVLVADTGSLRQSRSSLTRSAQSLLSRGRAPMPGYLAMLGKMYDPDSRPAAYRVSPVLTDAYAPVDGLLTE